MSREELAHARTQPPSQDFHHDFAENRAFLTSLIKRGKAANLAEALNSLIEAARRADRRKRLAEATVVFYDFLSRKAPTEERQLELTAGSTASRVEFDAE